MRGQARSGQFTLALTYSGQRAARWGLTAYRLHKGDDVPWEIMDARFTVSRLRRIAEAIRAIAGGNARKRVYLSNLDRLEIVRIERGTKVFVSFNVPDGKRRTTPCVLSLDKAMAFAYVCGAAHRSGLD